MPLITKLDHDGGSLYLTGYLSILWAGEDSAIVAMKSLPQKMRYLKQEESLWGLLLETTVGVKGVEDPKCVL